MCDVDARDARVRDVTRLIDLSRRDPEALHDTCVNDGGAFGTPEGALLNATLDAARRRAAAWRCDVPPP